MIPYFYISLFIGFFLMFFLIRYQRKLFYQLAESSVDLLDKLLSKDDEDAKIKLIEKSNKLLIRSILRVTLLIIIAVLLGGLPVYLFVLITDFDFQSSELLSFHSILIMSVGATLPFFIPLNKSDVSDYSDLSKLLHRLALNNYNLSELLFRKEKKRIRKKNIQTRNDFVIVSGLARSGTTSLMNDLSEVNGFFSLSYANMPFLMAPNLWAKIYRPKKENLKERSHKDGIVIGYNSNEALEEYFFKVKAKDAYIKDDALLEYKVDEDDYKDYLQYQAMVKNDDQKIYLAKNNNFMLRYKSVRALNNEFLMVVLFRDPLTHAASLMEKHKDYEQLQKQDPFILEYMNWLGHHEFGLNQKPFMFSSSSPLAATKKHELDYWLEIWINYYSYVLELEHSNTLFINYEEYCVNPRQVLKKILQKTNINSTLRKYRSFVNSRNLTEYYSVELYQKAMSIYNDLISKSK